MIVRKLSVELFFSSLLLVSNPTHLSLIHPVISGARKATCRAEEAGEGREGRINPV